MCIVVWLQMLLSRSPARVFCIDYVDEFLSEMPGSGGKCVAACINERPDRVQYAARCLLLLTETGVLLPIAIELIHPDRMTQPQVVTPSDLPSLWRMAKAHFLVTDGSWHQFVSHWSVPCQCYPC